MAYSTNNRPYMIVPAVGGGYAASVAGLTAGASDCGASLWAYRSTDTVTAVMASGYFTDGFKLGMRKMDIMFITQVTTALAVSTNAGAIGIVSAVGASSAATVGFLFSSST
jgi:hypothetical protein